MLNVVVSQEHCDSDTAGIVLDTLRSPAYGNAMTLMYTLPRLELMYPRLDHGKGIAIASLSLLAMQTSCVIPVSSAWRMR